MSLRPEEEFVRKVLLQTFRGECSEGEDPPDLVLEIGERKIAVEVSRLTPISFNTYTGTIGNRNSQDSFGIDLIEELNAKLSLSIPDNVNLFVILYVPVNNGAKFKRQLIKYVQKFLQNSLKVGERKTFEIDGERVELEILLKNNLEDKKIVGLINNKNSNADILYNAKVILMNRIIDKQEKCRNLKYNGGLWLVLLNDYWLADSQTYKQAIKYTDIEHSFDKILLIGDTGKIFEL